MNTFSTISRVLVVATVVFVGNASAEVKAAFVKKAGDNKYTFAAIAMATALPEGADAAKAAVETVGVTMDTRDAKGEMVIDPACALSNFAVNFGVRKATRCFAKNGYTIDSVGKAIDKVPVVGTHLSPMVTETVKAVGPQTVANLALLAALKALGA